MSDRFVVVKHEKKKFSLLQALFFSLSIHALLFLLVFILLPQIQLPQEEVIELIPFTEQEFKKYRLADIDEPVNQVQPNNTNLLGQYNSKVKEEMVASSPKKKKKAKKKMKQKTKSKDIFDFDKSLFSENRRESSYGSDDIQSSGGDFFPDYKFGKHTYLNVLRYPQVEYFVRLKRIFRLTWNPYPALKAAYQSNQVSRGRVSVVMAVTVDRQGNLDELFVLSSSGIVPYDKESLRAIRASSPFAKPPSKFLDEDGKLRMSWTFIQYI